MPILRHFKTEGGATVTWHRVSKVEASLVDSHAVAVAVVHSWPDLEAYIETDGGRFTWTSYVPIPQARIDGADLLGSVERALVALPESPLFGGSPAPMPTGLELAQQLRWAQMKQMRAIMSTRPILFQGGLYQADEASRMLILGSIAKMEILGQAQMDWTLDDNTRRVLSLDALRALGAAIGDRIDQCWQTARVLRERIFDPGLATIEELIAIVWPVEPSPTLAMVGGPVVGAPAVPAPASTAPPDFTPADPALMTAPYPLPEPPLAEADPPEEIPT